MHALAVLVSFVGSPARAAGPPATVLEQAVVVGVDAARRSTETVRWTIRVDDPAACAAGVVAPPGLDGATDHGAMVLETLFVPPPDAAAGSTYTLTATRVLPAGGHSGVFQVAPDLPTVHASLAVSAHASVPLAVWADPEAQAEYHESASGAQPRTASIQWSDIDPGELAQAAWSTWPDWVEAGRTLRVAIDAKTHVKASTPPSSPPTPEDVRALGKDLTADIAGLGVGGIVARVRETVALDPGPSDWSGAGRATDVFEAGHGTAADRGVALITLLRAAGFDASPGAFRSGSDPNEFPITVPAPALLPQPLVVVDLHRDPADGAADSRVWIDPAAEHTEVPDLPASLSGALVWVPGQAGADPGATVAPGELPMRLPVDPNADGAVTVTSQASIGADGSVDLRSTVQATGTAAEILRDLLGPLDGAGRTETFARLLAQARPGLGPVVVTATGIEDPRSKLTLTVQAHEPGALAITSFGMRGTMPAALAPALAGWLPPRFAVTESIEIGIPPTLQWAGTGVEPSLWVAEASVVRGVRHEGQKVIATITAERPTRARTPATDAAATEFLSAQAPLGVDAVLFAGLPSLRRLRTAPEVMPADRAALEMLVWYANDQPEKAGKTLRKALPVVGFDSLVTAVERFAAPGDLRPWQGIASQRGLGDARRVDLAEGVERAGGRSTALGMARGLTGSADPDVRVRSRLMIERLQGPDLASDPLWVDPSLLLSEAGAAGGSDRFDPRVAVRRAELMLAAGDGVGAKAVLQPMLAAPDAAGPVSQPLIQALMAHADARTGVTADRVRRAVTAAVDQAPSDPAVVSAAADALMATGDPVGALEHALTAARLADHDPTAWAHVVAIALAAGELVPAVDAAHRASDLDPLDPARATRWAELAFALGDKPQVDAARGRARMPPISEWPPMIDLRLAVDPAAVLAVLTHDDDVVTGSPRLLAVRAQLRIEHGMLDDAAADALALALRHHQDEGWVLAFAATVGRQYWSRASEALDLAARTDPVAMSTRMEYRLVAGNADPLEDARRLATDDPRARALMALATGPKAAAAAIPGWPADATPPRARSIPGFAVNRLLSTIPGVTAMSNPSAGAAILLVGAPTGVVPPPFAGLYPDPPQPVLTIDRGGQVLRLTGGTIPLYAAVAPTDGQEVWGFAFTSSGAVRALNQARPDGAASNP